MGTIKHSRQRDAVKKFLMSRTDHPTADVVYQNVRKEFPHISLGTVYRNLTFLVEHGEAITVPADDGAVHFDGNTSPHQHFHCTICKSIYDLFIPENRMGADYTNYIKDNCKAGDITGCVAVFYGECNSCKEKMGQDTNEEVSIAEYI